MTTAPTNIRKERHDGDTIVVTFDKPESTANTFDRQTLTELEAIVDEIADDGSAKAVVFTSAKSSIFVAGADLVELSKLGQDGIREIGEFGQRVFGKVADLRVPTAAAIHGACLGGGLELALACDVRVASDDRATKIGLPECNLGILPAWGGSTRLPRLIGLPKALDAILGAKQLASRQAKKLGVVDAVVPKEHVVREARRMLAKPLPKRPSHALTNNPLVASVVRSKVGKTLARKTGGHYPAFPRALEVVTRGVSTSVERSLANEVDALTELTQTEVCRHLVGIFFLQERAKRYRVPGTPEIGPERKIDSVAVVGAGVMGAGIAQWVASKEMPVILRDVSREQLAKGLAAIEGLIEPLVKRRKISKIDARAIRERIVPVAHDVPLVNTDLVIEAAVERMDVKRDIFARLAELSRDDTILATNTSALSVSELAESVPHPERVIGIHFFNPVARMQLVEVVVARQSSPETIARAVSFVQAIGKMPVVVKDSPGFVVNRVLTPYLVEAGRLFAEGASVEAIDRAMKRFGMPMGPLRLIDEVGGDVAGHVARHQKEHFPDRLEIPEVLTRMADEGLLGKKSGAGFYVYPDKGRSKPNERVAAMVSAGGPAPDAETMTKRMALAMVNEAARCLEEGLVEAPEDIDFAMIMGTGFAPFRGGPLRYADALGAERVVEDLRALASDVGPRFEPAEILLTMSREGKSFYSAALPGAAIDAA